MAFLRPEIHQFSIEIPDGVAGIEATLSIMARVVRDARKEPEIVATARDIVLMVPPKRYALEARALHAFVRDEIRYTRDTNMVEVVQTPENTLALGHGDCDDMAVLLASLLEAIGHPTRFVAAGFGGGPIEHVWAETLIGERWFAMDPTEPQLDFGQRPPGITETIVAYN